MRSRYGHVQKISSNEYRAHWSQNNKRRSKRFNNYKDACDHLARMQIYSGDVNPNIKYKEYYKIAIVPSYKHLSKRTAYEYRNSWSHVEPYLSDMKIANTNWRLVQSVIDEIPSAVQQRKDLAFIRRMLNLAVNDQIIPANPYCTRIKLRKERRQKKVL